MPMVKVSSVLYESYSVVHNIGAAMAAATAMAVSIHFLSLSAIIAVHASASGE